MMARLARVGGTGKASVFFCRQLAWTEPRRATEAGKVLGNRDVLCFANRVSRRSNKLVSKPTRAGPCHPAADGSTTVYVQVDQQTIADYPSGTAASSPTFRYIYGSYIDEPVLRYQPSGSQSAYYHRNQQCSVTALTNSSGAILERYAYSAYGVPTITNSTGTVLTSSAQNNRYTYTGREWDEDLNLYHYRARLYDPELGRFCSKDPIGYASTRLSHYEFVHTRPLVFTDPSGELVPAVIAGLAAALVACGLPQYNWAHAEFPDSHDKFKHCWVSCRISKSCTAILTQYAGLAKEAQDSVKRVICEIVECEDDGRGNWTDSLDDLIANQQCTYWDQYVPVLNWCSTLYREKCEDCCRRKVGY